MEVIFHCMPEQRALKAKSPVRESFRSVDVVVHEIVRLAQALEIHCKCEV